jgi:hypothetical protein
MVSAHDRLQFMIYIAIYVASRYLTATAKKKSDAQRDLLVPVPKTAKKPNQYASAALKTGERTLSKSYNNNDRPANRVLSSKTPSVKQLGSTKSSTVFATARRPPPSQAVAAASVMKPKPKAPNPKPVSKPTVHSQSLSHQGHSQSALQQSHEDRLNTLKSVLLQWIYVITRSSHAFSMREKYAEVFTNISRFWHNFQLNQYLKNQIYETWKYLTSKKNEAHQIQLEIIERKRIENELNILIKQVCTSHFL